MAENAKHLLLEAIEAHGGMEYWNTLAAVDAVVSARGFLFTAKNRPVLNRVSVRAFTQEPRFTFSDFPKPGLTAELIGDHEVRIIDSSGHFLSRRENPRTAFRGIRRLFYWDDLDFIYFCGYATWNYLTAPFLLGRGGFEIEALEPVQADQGRLTPLKVTFPPDIPAHSRTQVFYFDDRRLLRRLDYVAEVVGGWAHAAHFCDEYRTFGRLLVPTRRRVFPTLFGGKPLSGPILVDIEVHDVQPVAR